VLFPNTTFEVFASTLIGLSTVDVSTLIGSFHHSRQV
jgi:hypothetical protein